MIRRKLFFRYNVFYTSECAAKQQFYHLLMLTCQLLILITAQ